MRAMTYADPAEPDALGPGDSCRAPTRCLRPRTSRPAGSRSLLFIALAVAVAFLGISMNRHLRKTRDNADLGVFGPTDKERENHS